MGIAITRMLDLKITSNKLKDPYCNAYVQFITYVTVIFGYGIQIYMTSYITICSILTLES
jgi:hypothetical protein